MKKKLFKSGMREMSMLIARITDKAEREWRFIFVFICFYLSFFYI